MKAAKALELVKSYARLRKAIAAKRKEIGESLDRCRGISGKRGDLFATHGEIDSKGREKDLHLTNWYTPYTTDDGTMQPRIAWEHITQDEHGEVCQHCYAAHLAAEERKKLRKEWGLVKRSMSRCAE